MICLVSYLPWHNVLVTLLNKVAAIINEKDTTSLYHFIEAIYEYELPKPGSFAEIFSHDGLDTYCFHCPDRRIVPSINENRNLLKFFAFFDLEKIIKIFTALLLERHILIVSKDLENLTSCALSLEYLIHPLEWFHAFAPIMPEHIDIYVFNQPFPFIYGIHPCIYDKLTQTQLDECVILKVDERQVINGDRDQLPDNVTEYLRRKLKFFQESSTENSSFYENQSFSISSNSNNVVSLNKYDRLLRTGTIQAFLDSVLMIIDDYRNYLKFNIKKNEYELNEDIYFQMKNVTNEKSKKYFNGEKEFYHEFRITQGFEEFCRDRGEYLKAEDEFNKSNMSTNMDPSNMNPSKQFQKDFIESLFEQYSLDNSKFQQILKSSKKKFDAFKNKTKDNVSIMKKLLNQASATPIQANLTNPINKLQASVKRDSVKHSSLKEPKEIKADLFDTKNDRMYNRRSSTSSGSSSGSINDEKLKESIRQFAIASDSINLTLDKNLDELSQELELRMRSKNENNQTESNTQAYNRVTIDLTNDPDIKKYLNNGTDYEKRSSINNQETELKLIDIDSESDDNKTKSLEASIASPNKNLDPFDMDQFNPKDQITNQPKVITSESSSSLSWIDDQINNSIYSSEKVELNKKETTYQSIIDEFDPISSNGSSVSSKINHFNQMRSQTVSSNLANLTPKPFVSSTSNKPKSENLMKPNYSLNMPVQSPFNSLSMSSTGINHSLSHNSIKNYMNPTPFYGGYNIQNSSQPNYHPVAFPQSKIRNPPLPISQSNGSITTNNNSMDFFSNMSSMNGSMSGYTSFHQKK